MYNSKKNSGVYAIICSPNQKMYVGSSVNILRRWSVHKAELNLEKHGNSLLQEDWNRYGKGVFIFTKLELLDSTLGKIAYEEAELRWILKYNSHKAGIGYNKALPGSIPLREEDENKTILSYGISHSVHPTYVVSIETGKVNRFENSTQASAYTDVSIRQINDCFLYWGDNPKNGDKSYRGWIFIREKDYKEGFDYINYRRPAIITKERKRKPKDQLTGHRGRKDPKDIIPYAERNIKRTPIIAVNIETGEEMFIPSINECKKLGFMETKVIKCINHDYGRYKHKDHYFKRAKVS